MVLLVKTTAPIVFVRNQQSTVTAVCSETNACTRVVPEYSLKACTGGIDIVPFINDVITRWSCLTFPPLYPRSKSFPYPWNRRLFGHQNNIR